jgi:CheY-like chemotaxis protein
LFFVQRILIIDDDDNSLHALADLLGREGYEVECAPTGQEAIGAIMHATPDMVILDLLMPEVNGTSVLETIRVQMGLKALPVLVWTGLEDSELVERARQLRAYSIIKKGSVTFDDILGKVQAALAGTSH